MSNQVRTKKKVIHRNDGIKTVTVYKFTNKALNREFAVVLSQICNRAMLPKQNYLEQHVIEDFGQSIYDVYTRKNGEVEAQYTSCQTKISTLANELGLTERTLRTKLKTLEKHNTIKVGKNYILLATVTLEACKTDVVGNRFFTIEFGEIIDEHGIGRGSTYYAIKSLEKIRATDINYQGVTRLDISEYTGGAKRTTLDDIDRLGNLIHIENEGCGRVQKYFTVENQMYRYYKMYSADREQEFYEMLQNVDNDVVDIVLQFYIKHNNDIVKTIDYVNNELVGNIIFEME